MEPLTAPLLAGEPNPLLPLLAELGRQAGQLALVPDEPLPYPEEPAGGFVDLPQC